MAYEHARIRTWYRKIIALYPQGFREHFGESMEQTFNDLCHERRETGKGLFSFALRAFVEASAGAVRENILSMIMQDIVRKLIVLAAGVVLILLVPLASMEFTDEVAWTLIDFVTAGALLFGAGLTYVLLTRKEGAAARRVTVGVAIAAVLLLVWAELAVGVFGTPWAGS